MKRLFTFALALMTAFGLSAQGIYQFADPSFEQYTGTDTEPGNGWNSFNSATGSMAGMGKGSSPKPSSVSPGANGTGRAVKIFSKSILGKKANGNLTTGMINMGSMTPADASNHNYTKRSDATHSLRFAGRPDAVTFYAKFKSGGSPNGRGQFILHGDVDFRDPEVSDQASYRIGKASALVNASSDWVKYEAKFSYDQAQGNVQYLLATFTTNPTPGGSANDELIVDEIYFIYYHALTALSYNGKSLNPSENGGSFDLSAEEYSESKLSYTVKGAGATVEKSFNKSTGVLTLTVKGSDYASNANSKTVYTLQFAKSENPDPDPNPEPDPDPNPGTEVKPLGAPVSTLTELKNSVTYALYNPAYTAYAKYAPTYSTSYVWTAGMKGDNTSHALASQTYAEPFDPAAKSDAWMVVTFNGKYYIYNMEAKKFLTTPDPNSTTAGREITFSSTPVGMTAVELSNSSFALTAGGGDYSYMCAAPQLTNSPLSIWDTQDAGSAWQFMVNPKVEADLSVLALIDASIKPDVDVNVEPQGGIITNLDEIRDDKTYTIYNPTFKAYAIYDQNYASTSSYVWAAEMIGDAGHPLYTQNYSKPLDTTAEGSSWMIVPFDGKFYFYNVGADKFLSVPDYNGETKPVTFTESVISLFMEDMGGGNFAITQHGGSKEYLCAAPQNYIAPLSIWEKTDAGAAWQLRENPNVAAQSDILERIYPTAIQGVQTDAVRKGVYTISGVYLGAKTVNLPAGLYIIDGKKVLVK